MWPAMTPTTRLATVTWSADTLVRSSRRASCMPTGRKKWRSIHSSTSTPLTASALCGFTQDVLHRGQGLKRLLLGDDEWRVDPHFGVVDHGHYAALQQGIENPSR